MFRIALNVLCQQQPKSNAITKICSPLFGTNTSAFGRVFTANFSHFKQQTINANLSSSSNPTHSLLNRYNLIWNSVGTTSLLPCTGNLQLQQSRTIIKFSLTRGKRKTGKAVLRRFKRLDWGMWIRTRCGRHKKMWKKSNALKRRLRQHVFTNSTQSWLLDKFVSKYWRRPHYFVDDPYRPYHMREEYFATRKRPLKYD